MKILVVCQYYKPEPFRISDICEELARRGHEVTVLTGVPNYPMGQIYEGYRHGEHRCETVQGVEVRRCFTIGRRHGALWRFLNYYSFAISSKRAAARSDFGPASGGDFDVVLVNQLSPVMMAEAGIAYARKHKAPLMMYCLDLWPESLCAGGIAKGSAVYRLFHRISGRIYRACDRILMTSQGFEKYLTEEFGIAQERLGYLPQYAEELFSKAPGNTQPVAAADAEGDCAEKGESTAAENDNGGSRIIKNSDLRNENSKILNLVFAGNIGAAQRVDLIVRAAAIIESRLKVVNGGENDNNKNDKNRNGNVGNKGEETLNTKDSTEQTGGNINITEKNETFRNMKVNWHIVGDGSELEACKELAADLGVESVVFHGRHPVEEMPKFYSMADAMLLTLDDDEVISYTLPGKIQSYMAAGKPVIASANGETPRVIEDAHCGLCAAAGSAEALADAVERFASLPERERLEMGQKSLEYYENHFSRAAFMNVLERELKQIISLPSAK